MFCLLRQVEIQKAFYKAKKKKIQRNLSKYSVKCFKHHTESTTQTHFLTYFTKKTHFQLPMI